MNLYTKLISLFILGSALTGCQGEKIGNFFDKKIPFISSKSSSSITLQDASKSAKKEIFEVSKISDIISNEKASANFNAGFKKALRTAVENDPSILNAREQLKAQILGLDAKRAAKDFQINGTIYGGVEDLTDEVVGVAFMLRANRLIYDGGQLDSQISSENFKIEASKALLEFKLNERAEQLLRFWVDLERYDHLHRKIYSRLQVLDPLIQQLETIAEAGMGDVSQVAAAQRTVSGIRVKSTDVMERREQARVKFVNAFGALPGKVVFDSAFISSLVPEDIGIEMIQNAPGLLSEYASYLASEADVAAIRAKGDFNVGFESSITLPAGGSEYDSDEKIGLVARKTLYDGKLIESQLLQAEAVAKSNMSKLRSTYRDGEKSIKTAKQTISSMDKAVTLARESAAITREETTYLKKQLVIGGSTLDNVLSAEARLYDAEAREINYIAELRQAELAILRDLGLLADALGLE